MSCAPQDWVTVEVTTSLQVASSVFLRMSGYCNTDCSDTSVNHRSANLVASRNRQGPRFSMFFGPFSVLLSLPPNQTRFLLSLSVSVLLLFLLLLLQTFSAEWFAERYTVGGPHPTGGGENEGRLQLTLRCHPRNN